MSELKFEFKRLIGAMYLGFRIEQDSGHRYIMLDKNSDFCPEEITYKLDPNNHYENTIVIKEYGSYIKALDRIDGFLKEIKHGSLVLVYESIVDEDEDVIFSKKDTV